MLSSTSASQLTLSQIKVPTSRTFSGRSFACCWEPLLACPQVSTPSQMARVKGRMKKWRPPSVVWCHPTPCPRPNSWFGWNMPITFLSAQPQAFPPFSVGRLGSLLPIGAGLHATPAHLEKSLQLSPTLPLIVMPGRLTFIALKAEGIRWDRRFGCPLRTFLSVLKATIWHPGLLVHSPLRE